MELADCSWQSAVWSHFHELEAVAPGVLGVEAADVGQFCVPGAWDSFGLQVVKQVLNFVHCKCRVRLSRGLERFFDAKVDLAWTDLKPAAASPPKRRRFFDLRQAQNVAEKPPRFNLAASRGSDLDVIQIEYLAQTARLVF